MSLSCKWYRDNLGRAPGKHCFALVGLEREFWPCECPLEETPPSPGGLGAEESCALATLRSWLAEEAKKLLAADEDHRQATLEYLAELDRASKYGKLRTAVPAAAAPHMATRGWLG